MVNTGTIEKQLIRSIKKLVSTGPNIIIILLGCRPTHPTLIGLRAGQIVHIRHLAYLRHRRSSNKALLLLSAHTLVVLLVLGVLVLPLGLFLSIQHGQLLLKLVVFHAELAPDRDETAQAVDIVLVVLVDLLVHLQSLIEKVHSAITGRYHELPLDFLGLNLAGAFEVLDRLLEHVLLGVMHAKAGDNVDFGRVVSVAFLVEVNSLELVLFLLVKVAHFGENFRVRGDLSYQDIVPFEGLSAHTNEFIDVRDLI